MDNRTVNVFVESFKMSDFELASTYAIVIAGSLSYLFALCSNVLILLIIAVHVQLHQPMYFFLVSLSFNDMVGISTMMIPTVYYFLSEHRLTSFLACLFQALILHLYAGASFLILSAMAFDRYIAICHPLRYHIIMTKTTVKYILIVCSLVDFLLIGSLFVLTLRFPFCSTNVPSFYCDNITMLRMTCAKDITINNIYGLFLSAFYHIIGLFSILFSYTFILIVCFKNKDARSKALATCVSHFLVFLISECTAIVVVLIYRIPESPVSLTRVMAVIFVIIPSCLNPVIYGVKTKEIKQKIKPMYNKIFHTSSLEKPRLNSEHNT